MLDAIRAPQSIERNSRLFTPAMADGVSIMIAVIDKLASWSGKLAAAILAAMALAVIYEVVMRNLFNAPTVWSVEYTSYAMAWLGLLGAGETLRQGQHVNIRVVTDRFSERVRGIFFRVSNLVIAVVAACLLYPSMKWTADAYRLGEVSDTVLQTPQVFVRAAFPVGMALVLLVAIRRAVQGPAAEPW